MLRTLALGLSAFLSLTVSAVSVEAQPAPSLTAPRMVELDGRQVRVQTRILPDRKPGIPVVVFEAGLMSSLDAWRGVLPKVGATAPVVAYDRAGLGKSEWDGVRPMPRHVTGRLRRLLKLVNADPPYVLVGHSWGGMLAYYYAGYYPEEVAGLVLSTPPPF